MATIQLAIVGVGKIARDQHLPAIAGNANFQLIAAASHHGQVEGIQNYPSIEAMLAAQPQIQAVSLCMPPQARYRAAQVAIAAGKHVFMEKPPGATLAEVQDLQAQAQRAGVTLFASWHSRYAPAVEAAREFLASTRVRAMRVIWKEDVRRWHPGQDWIWQAGGLGVFDPGINALSIVTHILPQRPFVTAATLEFPANKDAPIAAALQFSDALGLQMQAEFDWRQTGPQSWDIEVETEAGPLLLGEGGSRLSINGVAQACGPEQEYPQLYQHFAELVHSGRSDVDLAPLQLVADAFMLGRRVAVESFEW